MYVDVIDKDLLRSQGAVECGSLLPPYRLTEPGHKKPKAAASSALYTHFPIYKHLSEAMASQVSCQRERER
jgi:hypothetical protein